MKMKYRYCLLHLLIVVSLMLSGCQVAIFKPVAPSDLPTASAEVPATQPLTTPATTAAAPVTLPRPTVMETEETAPTEPTSTTTSEPTQPASESSAAPVSPTPTLQQPQTTARTTAAPTRPRPTQTVPRPATTPKVTRPQTTATPRPPSPKPTATQTALTTRPTIAATVPAITPAAPTAAVTTRLPAPPPTIAPAATTAAATTRPPAPPATTPAPTTAPTKPAAGNYQRYANKQYNWWYRVPKQLNKQQPATIERGTASLISRYNGIWQGNPRGAKVVYLTMDAGYEYRTNTSKILDIARKKKFPITFFVTGGYIKRNPGLVKRMVREGHLVGNHSMNHPNPVKTLNRSTDAWLAEVQGVERAFQNLTGKRMAPYFRFPEGSYSERALKCVQDLGYRSVFWSFAYRDWDTAKQPGQDQAFAKIMGQLHPGSILLLHPNSATNLAILPRLIDAIRAKGYTIAPLSSFR